MHKVSHFAIFRNCVRALASEMKMKGLFMQKDMTHQVPFLHSKVDLRKWDGPLNLTRTHTANDQRQAADKYHRSKHVVRNLFNCIIQRTDTLRLHGPAQDGYSSNWFWARESHSSPALEMPVLQPHPKFCSCNRGKHQSWCNFLSPLDCSE